MAHTAIALEDKHEERKKRNKILGEDFYKDEDTEDNHSTSLTQKDKINKTTKGLTNDLLLGVIGGGLAGALLGKYSFFVGLGLAGYGHYSDNKMLGTVGLGMMASGTASALLGGKAQDPKLSQMEKVTERIKGFTSELKRKVWIDKWDSPEGLNGISNTNSTTSGKEKLDFSKKVEPIDHTKYSKLTKEEDAELDTYLENASINAFNQFYAKRHNVNGVNDISEKVAEEEKIKSDIENELKKVTQANNTKQSQTSSSSATNGISNSAKQGFDKHSDQTEINENNFNEDNLSGNIEDYMSDDLKNEFYKNQYSSASSSKTSKNKSWEDSIDVSDKLF